MKRTLLVALLVPGLWLARATEAGSGVPAPSTSSVDGCMVVCPAGDITFHVIVRDLASNPVANSTVVLSFNQCPGFTPCADPGAGMIWDPTNRTLRMISDGQGRAFFSAHAGGGYSPLCISYALVYADGVGLRSGIVVTSPDQDGNLIVDGADLALLNTKLGDDPTGDLTCDGSITAADVSVLQGHMDHNCSGIVPTRPSSWGQLRTIYR